MAELQVLAGARGALLRAQRPPHLLHLQLERVERAEDLLHAVRVVRVALAGPVVQQLAGVDVAPRARGLDRQGLDDLARGAGQAGGSWLACLPLWTSWARRALSTFWTGRTRQAGGPWGPDGAGRTSDALLSLWTGRALGAGETTVALFSLFSWRSDEADEAGMTLFTFGAGISFEAGEAGGPHGARGAVGAWRPWETLLTHGPGDSPQPVGAWLARGALGADGASLPRRAFQTGFSLGSLLSLSAFGARGAGGTPFSGRSRWTRLASGARGSRLPRFAVVSLVTRGTVLTRRTRLSRGAGVARKSYRSRAAFGAVVSGRAFGARGSSSTRGACLALLPSLALGARGASFSGKAGLASFARLPLLSHGSRISYSTGRTLGPVGTWSSGGSSGAGGTRGAHLAHVPGVTLLTRRARQTLQPHRPGGPGEASGTFVSFLPEEALLATGPGLPVSARGAWLSDGALGTCRPRRTLLAFVALASFLPRLPDLPLISVFSRGAYGASRTREPHGALEAVSTSRALGALLARGPFLSSRPWRALGPRSPRNADGPSSPGGASLPWRPRGPWGAWGALAALQSKCTHWAWQPAIPREAAESWGAVLAREAGRTWVTLCPFFSRKAWEALLTGGPGRPGVATLAHRTRFSRGTLRADHSWGAWGAGLALETGLASLPRMSWEPVLARRARGALWPGEPCGSLGSVGSPLAGGPGWAIASRGALGARLPGDASRASFTPGTRWASLSSRSRLPRCPPAALLAVGTREAGESDGALWPLSSWVPWQSGDAEFPLLPGGPQRPRITVGTATALGALGAIFPPGTGWANLAAVTLDAHVALEAREAIFTLLALGALQASDAVCSLHSARAWVADGPLGAWWTLTALLAGGAFLAGVPRGSVGAWHSREAWLAQGSLLSWRTNCTLGAWETLGSGITLLSWGAGLSLRTHIAFRAWLAVHTRHTGRSGGARRPLGPEQTAWPRFPRQPPRPDFSIVPPLSVVSWGSGWARRTWITPVPLLPRQPGQAVETAVALGAGLPRHSSGAVTAGSAPSPRLSRRARRPLHTAGTLRPHVSWLTLQTPTPRRTHGAGPPGEAHRASRAPQRQPGLLQDGLRLRLLG